jgi:hypothetical protein
MSKPQKEIYISVDIEADGPIPGQFSMLSLGAAAFDLEGGDPRRPVRMFEVNLKPLPEAGQDPKTMAWWETQPEAWEKATENQYDAEEAMEAFADWLEQVGRLFKAKPVFVGYPASYDFLFTYWYYVRFVGVPAPFSFSALDIKTMAMVKLGTTFRGTSKRQMPKRWFEGAPAHTHRAIDDAIGQGVLFVNMMLDKE